MAAAAVAAVGRVMLLLPLLFMHSAQVQGQGQVLNRSRTLNSEEERNATFRFHSNLYFPLDFAHLFTTVNFSKSIEHYNHLVFLYDENMSKLHSVVNGSYFNSTLSLLRAKLENAADYIHYCCFVINCDAVVRQSKTALPLMKPPSSDEIFFSRPSRLDWEKYLGRKKRQALLLAGAAFFGGVGLSIYNGAEIAYLKKKLGDEDNKIGLIAHRLRETDLKMSENEAIMFTMSKKINQVIRTTSHVANETEINRVVAHFSLALDNVINHAHSLSEMLTQKKLQPRFFHESSITQAFQNIQETAKTHNLIRANTEVPQILMESASFYVQDNNIFYSIHIPLHGETKFELYEYINAPLSLKNGSAVRISSPEKYVAVSVSEHATLTNEEHSKCLPRQKGLICPTAVTRRTLKASCLGSLYIGSDEHIRIHCALEPLTTFTEMVTKLDGNQVAIFSPPHLHTVAYITCPGSNHSREIIVMHSEVIQLENSCTLSTPNFIYRSDQQLDISSSFISRKLISVDSFQSHEITIPSTLRPPPSHGFRTPLPVASPQQLHWLLSLIVIILILGLILLIGILLWRVTPRDDRTRSGRRRRQRDEPGDDLVGDEDKALSKALHHRLPGSPELDVRPWLAPKPRTRWWLPCARRTRLRQGQKEWSIGGSPSPASPAASDPGRKGGRRGEADEAGKERGGKGEIVVDIS